MATVKATKNVAQEEEKDKLEEVSDLKSKFVSPSNQNQFNFLLIPKLLYFWLNASIYSSYIFSAKYLQDRWHISMSSLNYLWALTAFSAMASFIWTAIADQRGIHKAMLKTSLLVYCLSFLSLRLLEGAMSSPTLRMFVLGCILLVNVMAISILFPLTDALIFAYLKASGVSASLYGRQRLFGTLGQAAVTVLIGYLIDFHGQDAIFLSTALTSAVLLLVIQFGLSGTQIQARRKETEENEEEEEVLDGGVPLFTPRFVLLLATAFVVWLGRATIGNLLPLYLSNFLGLNSASLGVTLSFRIFPEILVFFLNAQLMSWLGVPGMFLLAQAASAIRTLCYALMARSEQAVWYAKALELLKGVANAMTMSSGVHLTSGLAPDTRRSTAQSLFSGIHGSIANALSGIFSGLYLQYDKDNLKDLFLWTALLQTATLLFYGFLEFKAIRSKKVK